MIGSLFTETWTCMQARALPWRTLAPALLLLLLLACAVGRTSSDETQAHISVQDARNGFAGELYSLGQRLAESGNWQEAIRAMLGAEPPPLPPTFLDFATHPRRHVLISACAQRWRGLRGRRGARGSRLTSSEL